MKDKKKLLLRVALSLTVYWISIYVIEVVSSVALKVVLSEQASYTAILAIDLLCSWLIGGWLVEKIAGE